MITGGQSIIKVRLMEEENEVSAEHSSQTGMHAYYMYCWGCGINVILISHVLEVAVATLGYPASNVKWVIEALLK